MAKNHPNRYRFGSRGCEVLGYICEFKKTGIYAEDIAHQLGMTIDAVRMWVSRLRADGMVQDGSPYRPTRRGLRHWNSELAKSEGA